MSALRWLGIAVGVMVAVAVLAIAAGALWLNTFIHSDALRQEIEARAGHSLGGTVKIDKVDFNLLEGIKLEGITIQIDASRINGQGALLVNVARVRCTYDWHELFNRRLKLTGVTLDKPQIVLTREANAISATTPGAIPPPAEPSTTSPGSPATAPAEAPPFQFVLDQAKLNDGTISVRDVSGASIVELQGVNMTVDPSGYMAGKDVTGTLKIATLLLPSKATITGFSTPFVYRMGAFEAKPFEASLFGGNMAGGYTLSTAGPSILDLNVKGIDVAKLMNDLNPGSSRKLSGSLDLQSKWRGVESGDLNGEGDVQVANGKLEGVKILQQLSQLLRVKELNAPVIKQAQTHFLVQNRQTRFTGLQLDSAICRITGDGTIGFDGVLNANLVLILSRDGMSKLPKEAASSFVQQADGTGSIAFQVTGTTDNPQTDLATRLLMQNTQIQNVIDKALNKFFH